MPNMNQGDHIFEKLNSLSFPGDFQDIFKFFPGQLKREKNSMECIFVGDHITCFSFSLSFPDFFLKKFKFPRDFDKIVFSILQNNNRFLSSRKHKHQTMDMD